MKKVQFDTHRVNKKQTTLHIMFQAQNKGKYQMCFVNKGLKII